MSETGIMGATETFEWRAHDGRVMRVTVNRGFLALEMLHRLNKERKGSKVKSATMGKWSAGAAVKAEWIA